jgi:hypothetical protein
MDEWDGTTDRRLGPDTLSLQNELKAVRHDLGRVAVAVTTLGSDEQMQKVMEAVVEEERRHRMRILTPLVAALLVVAALGVFQISLASQAKDTSARAADAATKAGVVATYVDHCLVHPSEATPGECGNTAATGQQSTAVLAIFCYLRVAPEARTDANARDCFRAASEQAKAASAATTTTTTAPRP